MTNFSARVAKLVSGKDVPRTESEKILMRAYMGAMDGLSLVKIFLQEDENKLVGDNLQCFILGYSAGSATRKFTLEQMELTPGRH